MENKIHELKTWNPYFEHVRLGFKTFELRKNDRDYKMSDEVLLREWDPKTEEYTGRILHRYISYILNDPKFGLQEGYVILGLKTI